jgi:hypothetical protein
MKDVRSTEKDRAATMPEVATMDIPKWSNEVRALLLNGQSIKRFKQPAAVQETILNTFEEDGWPPHIDDPLPPEPGMTQQKIKFRLRKAVEHLNRAQSGLLRIRFSLDGTGQGVYWSIESGGRAGESQDL